MCHLVSIVHHSDVSCTFVCDFLLRSWTSLCSRDSLSASRIRQMHLGEVGSRTSLLSLLPLHGSIDSIDIVFASCWDILMWIMNPMGSLQGGLHRSLAFTHLYTSVCRPFLGKGNGMKMFLLCCIPMLLMFPKHRHLKLRILCESEGLLNVTYAFPVLPSASVTHLDAHLGDWVVAPWKQTLFVALETSKNRNWFHADKLLPSWVFDVIQMSL